MELKELIAQGMVIEPFVVTAAAAFIKATNLKTQYKPSAAVAVGTAMGAFSSLLLQQPVSEGIIVGFVAGCTAALAYLAGRAIEKARYR